MIVSVAYFILYFLLFLALLALLVFNRKHYRLHLSEQPHISILIAARNEESSILHCLQAIERLKYPKGKVEVLIGDDASTDATKATVEAFIRDKPNYRCITITENIGKAKGKANVLAHLAKLATTDFFFFTDADIEVPLRWVQGMLSEMKKEVGIVTGITTITGNSLFARLQALDWLYALGLMQVVSDLKLPVTTMGNNMLIRRQAYEQVGGFENVKFSVTEDVAIFNQIIKKGWGFRNIYDRSVLTKSEPASNLMQLLHQRKRWMRGSMHLPLYMVVILVLHAAYYPVLLPFFAYTSVGVMLGIFLFKLLLQSIYVHLCLKRVGQHALWWQYVFLEFYLVFTSVVLIIFFFLPINVRWKGRQY
ncbi:glycosyltransferase [Pontibacter silvestris]|uniref:Glycosyltransferase n=1 Tax=Pontibacter silvestris TaxID=2305183 RepID=A0ABW4WZV2_9BACT|nr:glycosyltransferase [Pontibacter silvestris]MCC9137504.1 glycosyltransferase [Pontibacter silvestris]